VADIEKQIANLSPAKQALLARRRSQNSSTPAIHRRRGESDAPLSFSQQRLWLIHEMDPDSYLYNVPRFLKLTGKLDLSALEASLNEIIRRHEVLRTKFELKSGEPIQTIAPSLTIPLLLINLSLVEGQDGSILAKELAMEEYRRPFDFVRAPLIRARLWKVSEEEHHLLLVMHHIVSDGWTGSILFEELGAHYRAFANGEPSNLPELSLQYADFATWQRSWMDSAFEKSVMYWRDKLAGAPTAIELPTDYPRPDEVGFRAHVSSLLLTTRLSQQMTSFAKTHGVTLFPLVMAGLKALLFRWTGERDLVVGTISANRNSTEVENLIGCFMNFLALRDQIDEADTGLTLLAKVKQTVLDAFTHQDCPFEKVVEALKPQRSANVNPLYNVSLQLQNYPEFAFHAEGLEARFLPFETQAAFLDIRFLVTETKDGLLLECESNADLFSSTTGELLLAGYRDLMQQIIEQPEHRIAELSIPNALVQQGASSSIDQELVAVTATFTAEPLSDPLSFWMRQLDVPAKIKFAPYDQVFQQLLDTSSLLSTNTRGANVVLLRIEDLHPFEVSGLPDAPIQQEPNLDELITAVRAVMQRSTVPYLICVCPPSIEVCSDSEWMQHCHRAETLLAAAFSNLPGVQFVSSPELLQLYPVSDYHDDYAWKIGHIPYTSTFFAALATMIARLVYRTRTAPRQVVVLGCEDTLWNATYSDQTLSGILVSPLNLTLQSFAIAQQDAGSILCLCSKSSEADIAAVFENNGEMLLGWEHITASRFGQAIAQSLEELAEELGLSLDTFIYLDVDPITSAEVREYLPDVLAPQIPLQDLASFLQNFWAFDKFQMQGSITLRTRADALNHIARDLSSVPQILRAIELEKTSLLQKGVEYAAPRSPLEELLADIWAGLLNIEAPGIYDNFFALGGNSLLAVQLLARVRQTLEVELPLRVIFSAPTIAELALRVHAVRNDRNALSIPPLSPVLREIDLPLSFSQQRLWFMDLLEPGNPLYNIPQIYRMQGELQPKALEDAINEIVRRHETLRTTFHSLNGEPVQIVAAESRISLDTVVLTGLSSEARESAVEFEAKERALQAFDLMNGPLLRTTLLVLDEQEHVLLLTLHHIVGDGWSGNLLARELVALYEAFSQKRPSPLPELAIQYVDFAVWQRNWLQGEVLDTQVRYWKKQLADAPAVLELPTDRPRPAVQRHRGAVHTHILPLELLKKLKTLSQTEGATLFMTLLAGFQLLLSRYSGQNDIVVGSPIASRNYTEIEPLIGFFVNTLALRTNLAGEPTFRELLTRVKQTALDAYAHQEIPFERLVEELRPERSLSYNPIFQVLFGLQTLSAQKFELPALSIERNAVHQATSTFDLAWFVFDTDEGLLLRVEYDTDLFDNSTIRRILNHFEILMESISTNPERRISDLQILGDEERNRILVEFNSTSATYPDDLVLHDFITFQSKQSPKAIALVCDEDRLSYSDLNAQANQLAHYLIKCGAGPDVLIGIHAERSAKMLIGILGILKAGSAYVPLDPNYPKQRLGNIVHDALMPIILTQSSIANELPDFAGQRIYLDTGWSAISQESAEDPVTSITPQNLAYVLFTSGSTGRPKGVAIEHRSAATFVNWARDVFSPRELAGVLFSTSMCFDLSVFEMFVPLSVGGKVILADNALYLPTLPARDEVTLINTVPSAIAELVRMGGVPDTVTTVNLAGEALPEVVVEQIYATTKTERVYNLYGPTEDTTYSTYTLVRRGISVTVGRPIANTQAYILDANLKPAPIGVPGELYLAGDGLARGYYGHPDLTSERFVPNPFSSVPGTRMYRTSDLTRFLPDGTIEYLGRMDYQVKIRGFRIELGDIENALDSHSSVRQSIVMACEDELGDKRLVAYVVPDLEHNDSNVAATEDVQNTELFPKLRRWLGDRLPEFMIPAAFVLLDSMPLSPNGKINRSALPVPELSRDETSTYIAPRTPLETNLAEIWSEVLHVSQVGAQDNFFSLGGHSLLATQVISRIQKSMGIVLPLRAIFEFPTISELGIKLTEITPIAAILPSLELIPRDGSLPLSFAQQRMWFLDQLEPGKPHYNIPCALRISSSLNLDILQHTIDALVERHETLRSNFAMDNGHPIQTIATSLRIPVQLLDLSHLASDSAEQEARRVTGAEAQQPFNLAVDPLLRVTVVRLSSIEHILFLNIHHIISDRWSLTVLLREIAMLYGAFSEGKPSPLPTLPVQYVDFAAWQHRTSKSEAFEKQLAYWKEELKEAPPMIELPPDRPRQSVASLKGETENTLLSPELTRKLNELSRNNGATLFMTLLAAFGVLLSRHSDQEDLVVGMPIASRGHPEIEGLIGLFANTLPLRLRLTGDPSFREILARTRDTALRAYAHQDVPFERLVEELHPDRSLSYDPLVQVYFILQNAPYEGQKIQGLDLQHIETNSKTSKGDLYFSLSERSDGLHGRLEYNTDLFNTGTIKRILQHYRNLLESAAAKPELAISQLTMLDAEERKQVLVDWNATDAEYPRNLCLHQMFETQVERSPDAIACVFENERLTYSELNGRANQVAHMLQGRGVSVGQRVGLFIERSLNMMIGLLGIQKSGAAYVPLDPSYPTERLRFTLEDAQVRVILTQQTLLTAMPEHQAEVVCLDRDRTILEQLSTNNPDSGVRPDNLVYVIFTSGTTGRPKGVQVPHGAVVNLLTFMAKELQMGSSDVFPALASFAFDMCIPELYLSLVSGGQTVIGTKNLASNGEELAVLLRKTGATIVHATPTTWNLLLEAGFTGKGLKRVIGAEPLPRELCTRLLEADGSLYNFYGPTETTVWSAFHHFCSPAEPIVVGRPLANTQIYILDKMLQPTPVGVPGEIHIAGDGVTCGYLNRPDLTAAKFIADPFSQNTSARMYKTGDLGRFLPDGRIEFQGRVDNQVKVRGYRIELGEIETVLGSHPSVQECVVIAREEVQGDKRLVSYVVPAAGTRIDPSELRQWVKDRLPDYMVPVAWVEMPRMPLSPNGKVDRKSLPVPEYVRPELSSTFQQAGTPTEEVIVGIWAEILKLDQVGLQDDFFELGGHSLLATQVVSRIRQTFQVELPLRILFEDPNVAALAVRVENLQRQTNGLKSPAIQPTLRNRPLPLSFAQQRLWFLDQLEPNNPLYNVPYIVRMKGVLQPELLDKSLQEIIRRHETLRTTFQMLNDEPVQIIASELNVPYYFTDLTAQDSTDREAYVRYLVVEEVKRPFDLKTGPLLRAALFKLDEQDHVFVLNTHHIISDRWSLGVLSQELAALYEAYDANLPSPLTDLPIQYVDYAVWQREFMAGSVLHDQLNYWKQELEGAPPILALPTDRPRQSAEDFWGATYKQPLAAELVSRLRALSRQNSVTFFMTLIAGFQILLARQAGQDDIVLGTDLANRTQLETERLIGFFVNLLPIRGRLQGDPTFQQILARVRETSLGAYAHQDIPFDKLVEELQPERSLTHNPLVQVLFVMQNTPQVASEFGGLTIGPLGVNSSSRFDLVLFVNDPDGSPSTTWMYNPNLFDASTIERMAHLYEVLLQKVTADPSICLSSLHQVLTEAERDERETRQKAFQEASLHKLRQPRRRIAVQM
jgi:amino acid adenylation domain-containing protein